MPIIFVDEKILDYKLECVVCPIKGNQMYYYRDIDGLIYTKAGFDILENEFLKVSPNGTSIPALSKGAKLSKYMIHIIGPDMIYAEDFKLDMYNAYDRTMRLIKKSGFKSVIFPPIPFSYKRLGNMHSYKTAMTLIKYFAELYDLTGVNIYVLVNKRTMQDHLDNYVSTYVSTSQMSRRHKPLVYPLKTTEELMDYLKEAEIKCFDNFIGAKTYQLEVKNSILGDLCELIKDKCKDNDLDFCMKANIHKDTYIKLFTEDFVPSKHELLAILMTLELELTEVYKYLCRVDMMLSYEDIGDCRIIAAIATHKYDVLALNQELFIQGLAQLGTNIHPSNFVSIEKVTY